MSLNKKTLASLFQTMLASTSKGFPDTNARYATKVFLGSDATVQVTPHGQAPVTLVPPGRAEPKPTIALVDEGCTALERFVDECNKDECIGRRVGRKAIEGEVEALLRLWMAKAADEAVLALDMREMLKRLRAHVQPWTVYFSVDNLKLVGLDELTIGSVRLLPVAACRSDLKSRFFSHIDGSPNDADSKQAIKLEFNRHVDECYPVSGTVAIVSVEAEKSRLRDVAGHAVGEAFGVLRSFTHVLFPRQNRCIFNLRGLLLKSSETWLTESVDGKHWLMNSELTGAYMPFEITAETRDEMKEHCGLGILNDVLSRCAAERTQMESALIVACQWHGAAINVSTPAEEFVWHTVALERLLICDEEPSTTDRFATRLAWVLGSTGQERRHLAVLASRLYGIRSRIVHAGETRVEQDDLDAIDILASRTLITLARRSAEWESQAQMRSWVGQQLMGA